MGIYIQEQFSELTNKNLILGIDPGRDKTGFAFVNRDGNLIMSGIFDSESRDEFFDTVNFAQIKFLALGNGTKSKDFYNYLTRKINVEIRMIDEKNTTLEARKLYWKIHKPNLLQKLIPESMRVPKRILDDLAAWAIALRALKIIEI